MTAQAAFDPLRLFRELNEAGVRFVVINLTALVNVLQRLNARLRGTDRPVPFRLDARRLAKGRSFTFATDAGDLDLLARPGTDGFEDLVRSAEANDLDGLTVLVTSIDDLIRMKRACGRPKDLIELEVLGALRDELDQAAADERRR